MGNKLRQRFKPSYAKMILENTVLRSKPLVPEIRLQLIDKSCQWYHQSSVPDLPEDPFWAVFWPGGQALSRFLLDHPDTVRGKQVLDMGSGCGASSIAARLVGASSVICNDIDKVSLEATELNASANYVTSRLTLSDHNFLSSSDPGVCLEDSVVLLGDMFYDENMASSILNWMKRDGVRGGNVYIGDPGRWALTNISNQLVKIAEYEIEDEDCEEFRTTAVYQMKLS